MALTYEVISEVIRQRLGSMDDSIAAKVLAQIPTALKSTARILAASPFTRSLICTEKTLTTLPIGTNGAVNLITGYDSYQFLKEYIDKGQMYLLLSLTGAPYQATVGGHAGGSWHFVRNPVHNETIIVNGVTFTFRQPGLSVSGSGEVSMNNPFIYAGEFESKPFYTLGSIDYYCRWETDAWYFLVDDLSPLYVSTKFAEGALPWEVATWDVTGKGVPPAPVVAKGSFTNVQVEIGATAAETATLFAFTLNASANAAINVATYAAASTTVFGTYDATGSGGNAFTMANSSGLAVIASGSTFSGGGDNTYGISISSNTSTFTNLMRVRFTTTGSLPTGLSLVTDYYIINYSAHGDTATFGLSSTANGLTPVTITSTGSGTLTMSQMDARGNPIQPLRSPQQAALPQYLGSVFQYYYIQADQLFLIPDNVTYPSGNVAFAVPYFPINLAALPDSKECERVFLQELTNEVAVAVQPIKN